jgi:hypothetical protein
VKVGASSIETKVDVMTSGEKSAKHVYKNNGVGNFGTATTISTKFDAELCPVLIDQID